MLNDDDKDYIRVSFSGYEAPYACKGIYRIRSADEDVLMTAAQVEGLLRKRIESKNPWDSRPSQTSILKVDETVLKDYVARGQQKDRIAFSFTNPEDVLSRLDLLVEEQLTNAANVLFCKSNEIRLKMGILETHSRTHILDLNQESGTIFDLVNKGVSYIVRNMRRRFVMDGLGPREEIPEIPTLAVREALMNAYAHQDWTLGGCV